MANFTALKTAINNAIKTNGNEEITGAVLQAILDAMVETLGDSAITDLENAITTEVTNRENAVGGVADDLAAEVQARQALDYNVNNRINAEEYNRQNADAALSQTMSQGFQALGSQMTALNAAISALNAAYQNGFLYGGIATPSSSPSNNKCFYIALQGGTYTNFGGVGVVQGINILKNDNGWKVEHIYDQTTLLNEFYLLRKQVIQAITSFAPIVIEGDVTNAPDEEDLTSNAQHLLQFKNNAYSPLEFSGLGRKYLRKNIAPLSESAAFNGFVEGVTAEETLSGTPEYIFWDRMNTRFVGIKDGVYYADWSNSDNYVPASTSLVYMYKGTPYRWDGSDFSVDETEVPNLVNCLTQDMINEANTIYIIRYDYTLKEDITIPANCVLQFDGGSISGEHTITGTNTAIQAGLVQIFSTDVTLAGTWNITETYPEWFGAVGDGTADDTEPIQKALDFASLCECTAKLANKKYVITSTIYLKKSMSLIGTIGETRWQDAPTRRSSIIARMNDPYSIALDVYVEDKNGNQMGIDWNGSVLSGGDNSAYFARLAVKNIAIVADTPAFCGMRACYCPNSVFENIEIKFFFIGLKIQRTWCDTFQNMRLSGCEYGIFDGIASTMNSFTSIQCIGNVEGSHVPELSYFGEEYDEWRQFVYDYIEAIKDYLPNPENIALIACSQTSATFNSCSLEQYRTACIADNRASLVFNNVYVEVIENGFAARNSSIIIHGMYGGVGSDDGTQPISGYMYDETDGTGKFILENTFVGSCRNVNNNSTNPYILIGKSPIQNSQYFATSYGRIYLGLFNIIRIPQIKTIFLGDGGAASNDQYNLGDVKSAPISGEMLLGRELDKDYVDVDELYIAKDTSLSHQSKQLYINRDTQITIDKGKRLTLENVIYLNANLTIVGRDSGAYLDFKANIRPESNKNIVITLKNITIDCVSVKPNNSWLIYSLDNTIAPSYLTVRIQNCQFTSNAKNLLVSYNDKKCGETKISNIDVVRDYSVFEPTDVTSARAKYVLNN